MSRLDGVAWGVVLGGALASSTAAAADPAVLYVPDIDIALSPTGVGECSGVGGQDHSALGCTGIDAAMVVPPYPGSAALVASLEGALAPYDVLVTQLRPPAYLPYTMLLPSDEPNLDSESFTCTAGGTNCEARKRNDIVFTFGSTQQCPVSDPLHAALFAFGRASGLEGVSQAGGVMSYLPDYTMPASSYLATCSPRVQPFGLDGMGEVVELPFACTSLDHVGCPSGEQAGEVELLDRYGARVVDMDPPQFSNITPADGEYFLPGEEVVLDVDVADADPVIGLRWTVVSPAIVDFGYPDGLSMCTNDVCDVGFDDANPLKATDSDWSLFLAGLPEGDYEVTLEASDFHGNVATAVVSTFHISTDPPPPPPPPGTTSEPGGTFGDETVDGESLTDGGVTITTSPGTSAGTTAGSGPPGVGDDSTGGEPEADEGSGLVDPGCVCSSRGRGGDGLPWLLVAGGLMLRRRRR